MAPAKKANRKMTDFFPRRSQGSSVATPASSQPYSSPLSSPLLSQSALPSSSQLSTPHKLKPKPTTTTTKKRTAPRADVEVISLSSDSHKGPIIITDDSRSHVSISSDSVIVISDSSSAMPKPNLLPSASAAKSSLLPSASTTRVTRSKSKNPANAASASASTSKHKLPAPTSATPAVSSAKTSIKRRTLPASASPTAIAAAVQRKRKHRLDDFDSPSDDSAAGSVYIANPDTLAPALSHAPVTFSREDLIPRRESVLRPRNRTPVDSGEGKEQAFKRSSSTPSKRLRLSPPSPPPYEHEHPLDKIAVTGAPSPVKVSVSVPVVKSQALSSGNEADVEGEEEEVPSSQSNEHELTLPKPVVKNPEEINARVDEWRRTSSVAGSAHGLSPLSEPTALPSDGERPPSSPIPESGPELDDSLPAAGVHPSTDDHPGMDVDFDMDMDMNMELDAPTFSPLLSPPPETRLDTNITAPTPTNAHTSDEEAEVSQQLQVLPSTASSGDLSSLTASTLSSAQLGLPSSPARPVTPPPTTPLPLGASSNSPFAALVASPFKPLPDEDLFRLSADENDAAAAVGPGSPSPVPLDSKAKTAAMIAQIKAQAALNAHDSDDDTSDSEGNKKKGADWTFEESESSDDDSSLDFKYDYAGKRYVLSRTLRILFSIADSSISIELLLPPNPQVVRNPLLHEPPSRPQTLPLRQGPQHGTTFGGASHHTHPTPTRPHLVH